MTLSNYITLPVNEFGATHILVVGDFNYPELNGGGTMNQ